MHLSVVFLLLLVVLDNHRCRAQWPDYPVAAPTPPRCEDETNTFKECIKNTGGNVDNCYTCKFYHWVHSLDTYTCAGARKYDCSIFIVCATECGDCQDQYLAINQCVYDIDPGSFACLPSVCSPTPAAPAPAGASISSPTVFSPVVTPVSTPIAFSPVTGSSPVTYPDAMPPNSVPTGSSPSMFVGAEPPDATPSMPRDPPVPAPSPASSKCPEELSDFWSCANVTGNLTTCQSCLAGYFAVSPRSCDEVHLFACGIAQTCPQCGTCQDKSITYLNCLYEGYCNSTSCSSSSTGPPPPTEDNSAATTTTTSTTSAATTTTTAAAPMTMTTVFPGLGGAFGMLLVLVGSMM